MLRKLFYMIFYLFFPNFKKPIVLIDLDDTMNNFSEVFWGHYNRIHNDHVDPETADDWDLGKFAKPEVGGGIYELMKMPGLFRYLKPHSDANDVIGRFMDKGIEVLVVSDSPSGTSHCEMNGDLSAVSNPADDKRRWVKEHLPLIPKENVIFSSVKWFIKGDVLIDDKPQTFLKFQEERRPCILIDKPYNRHIVTEWRAHSLTEAESMVYKILRKKGKL